MDPMGINVQQTVNVLFFSIAGCPRLAVALRDTGLISSGFSNDSTGCNRAQRCRDELVIAVMKGSA
jgi:hypothetical protein